jgi:hypothetical protein
MWLRAFILTQLLEIPLYSLALRSSTIPKRLVIAFGASLLTHPIVWALTGALAPVTSFWAIVAIMELFAVAVEGLYLSMFGVRRPYLWAFLLNTWSFGVGLVLQELLFH